MWKRRLGAVASALLVCSSAVAIVLVGVSGAGAHSGAPRPLQVRSASLVQQGDQLIWSVQLAQPFAPGGLARDQRTLCLLFEREGSGAITGEACLSGPARHSRQARILYTKVSGAGKERPRVIAAVITRTSSRQLSASFAAAAVGLSFRPLRWQVVSTLRAVACAPPSPGRGSCFDLYPAKPALLRLHSPVPVGCVPAGPSLVYNGPSRAREIALTFDDGPWNQPAAGAFLHVLEREDVPATFFEIGRQIAGYDPGGVAERRMLADGDMIGDHTWSHPNMPTLSAREQRAQLLSTASAIRRATHGFTPCLWRPPYGAISRPLVSVARSLGMLTIMWDIDPRDWAYPGVDAIYGNVVANARNGAIVLQHFGGGPRYQTLDALPKEIETLRRRGYRFVTVAQLLGLRLLYR